MIENPEYIKVDGKKYKINTSYKVALRCNEISMDETIGRVEKMLAIIYLLFGEEALEDKKNYEKFFELAIDYLRCGEELDDEPNEEPDMSFSQDYRLIRASFKSDYGIDIEKEDLHWWDFYTYLNGLTENCVLNRVRELRTYDTSGIKDVKERERINRAKKRFALKQKEKPLTEKQRKSVEHFYELTGIKRR